MTGRILLISGGFVVGGCASPATAASSELPAHRLPGGGGGSRGGCRLDVLVPHDARGELGLGLGQAGAGAAVHLVYRDQTVEVSQSGEGESDANDKHEDSRDNSGRGPVSHLPNGSDQATGSHPSDPQSVQDAEQELEEEDEEEQHEVERAVVPECFVGWPEPADVGQRCQQCPVEEGKAEGLAFVSAAEQVDQGHDHVPEEQANVSDP